MWVKAWAMPWAVPLSVLWTEGNYSKGKVGYKIEKKIQGPRAPSLWRVFSNHKHKLFFLISRTKLKKW
jgi:hypothetical protein